MKTTELMEVIDTNRRSRRAAMKSMLGAVAGVSAAAAVTGDAEAQTFGSPATDAAVLNFALNLEYLEGEYYSYAFYGTSITAQGAGINGSGVQGGVTIKANPQVPFATPAFAAYAKEIADDEINHVKFLRAALASVGVQPVARPQLDLLNSFTTAARAAGVVGPTQTFDPFADELSFLVGAYIFEDVGVTAYKGAAPLLKSKPILEAAAGILAAEAYHAGIVRTLLFAQEAAFQDITNKISDLRDALDGAATDLDQGTLVGGVANLFPADANSLAYSRNTRQVLNIVYGAINATNGLFFPAGMNGAIR